MKKSSPTQLNVANITSSTHALGPGERAVVWVQGCPFHCSGCIAPEWIPQIPAQLMSPEQIVEKLLRHPSVTGLTFSGGEPMLQAAGLAHVARLARSYRKLNIICFTGFRYKDLIKESGTSEIHDLLKEVDVLIDGNYVKSRNSGKGLRGSDNQHIIHLTDNLKNYDLENDHRQMEVQIRSGEITFVGIPPLPVGEALDRLSRRVSGGMHERI